LGYFPYECPVPVPIPDTGEKPDTPTDAIQSGINHLNIGNLTLSDVAGDDSNDDSDLEFSLH